jgi:TPR repeat protein
MRVYLFFIVFLTACTDSKGRLDETECMQMNVAESCHTWAKKLENFDMPKAISIYTKACKMNHADDCVRLGDLIVSKSSAEAQTWYKQACTLGNTRACLKQAEQILQHRQ